MMNIERAWDIVQEVWRRADKIEEEFDNSGGGSRGDCTGSEEAEQVEGGNTMARVDAATVLAEISCSSSPASPAPADLWRQVSVDMGVDIVFG